MLNFEQIFRDPDGLGVGQVMGFSMIIHEDFFSNLAVAEQLETDFVNDF